MTGEWKGGEIETMYQLKATSKRGGDPPCSLLYHFLMRSEQIQFMEI